MLHVLKSVADFLRQTTSIDMLTASPDDQNLAHLEDATLETLQVSGTTPNAVLLDGNLYAPLTFLGVAGASCGVRWTTPQRVDGLRAFFLTGTVSGKLQLYDGETWTDDDGTIITPAIFIWSTMRLSQSALTYGIRFARTSGSAAWSVTEIDIRSRLDIVPRPALWPANAQVIVCTNTTDLSDVDPDVPLVTVSAVDVETADGEVGNFSVAERTMVFIGLHAASDDQVDTLRRWAQMVLETAIAPSQDGSLTQGLPLRAYNYPLTFTGSGALWASGQHDWLGTPVPIVRVANSVTAPDYVDLGRGQVKLTGTGATADVRADFTVGAWEFDVRASVRTLAGEVAAVQHLHNVYLALESTTQFRAVDNALL